MNRAPVILVFVGCVTTLSGQAPNPPAVAFEVASVKPGDPSLVRWAEVSRISVAAR
jgi:hypothetical protein